MNKNKILYVIVLLIIYVNFPTTHWWCFVQKDILFIVKPSDYCLSVKPIKTCSSNKLLIQSSCNKTYYLADKQNKPKKINRRLDGQITSTKKIEKWYTVYDFIPYNQSKWEKKLININNENDIIYIYWQSIPFKNFKWVPHSINDIIRSVFFHYYKYQYIYNIIFSFIIIISILFIIIRKTKK